MSNAFDDLLGGNAEYARDFGLQGLRPAAERGLGLVTCMDSRIDPLAVLGLKVGDAKVLRNPGGRVTDDVLTALVISAYLLEVDRVLVMPHTKCKMASVSGDREVHELIQDTHGVDTRSLDFGTDNDQAGALRRDLERVRHHPLLPKDLPVAGALYDVDTGRIELVDA
ncbi:beta-class carbonic anhydrase [Nocardiopsis halophila]|uniref:beta-class carbonic anhydrase n=1 Tax=Nocardiopsis halophila TaxID=141692 RepID=UPI00034A2190|nr:carbonic anhydrase [Nocardiopsis halophila]